MLSPGRDAYGYEWYPDGYSDQPEVCFCLVVFWPFVFGVETTYEVVDDLREITYLVSDNLRVW